MIRLLEESGLGKFLEQALGLLMELSPLRAGSILIHDCECLRQLWVLRSGTIVGQRAEMVCY